MSSLSIQPPAERWRSAFVGERFSGAAVALGVFASVQTFVFFARRDRFAVLFWWTRESWLYVALLWGKDLVLAAAAFFAFLYLARATAALPEPVDRTEGWSRLRHAVLFAGILAAGVALRWVSPVQIPPGVWGDAPAEAEAAFREPGEIPWFGGRPLGVEGWENSALVSHLYLKFCELLFQIFGRGDVGILALSAVGGSLALPTLYWLGRETAGRHVGLAAMTLFALAMSPLVLSRWAWTAALLLPLVFAAAAAALRALATGRVAWAILAGLLLGLSLHTYVSSWATAAGFGIFALTALFQPGKRRLVFAAGISALVAFLPFGLAFLEFPDRLGGRARDVSLFAPTRDVTLPGGNGPFAPPLRLLHNAFEYTGLLLWTGDPNPKNGMPGRPVVTAIVGLAALAGIAVSWRRAHAGSPRHRLLLLLAGASLLAGILSDPGGAPNALRIYPFVGVAVLLAAESLVRWVPAAARAFSARSAFLWALGFSLLLVLETEPFLTVWPDDHRVVGSFCVAESEAGRTARLLGPAPIILEPKALSWPIVFETLAAGDHPRRPVARMDRRTANDLVRSPPDRPFWFVARDADLETLRRASWRCPPRRNDDDRGRVSIARVVPPGT